VELLEAYLGDTGYDVRTAADGEETLRLIREWKPDLVLLDVMMPRISGFEVCKRLRADSATRNVAVIMVTALDQSSDMERAVEAGPADGAEVELVSHAGHFVARGFYNGQSKIRVRLYSWTPDEPLDRDFFRRRLETAIRLRRDVLKLDRPGGACRLVFSEGDGLSGLTVDRYDRWLVAQFTALGLAQRRELLAELLTELTGAAGVYLRTERGMGKL